MCKSVVLLKEYRTLSKHVRTQQESALGQEMLSYLGKRPFVGTAWAIHSYWYGYSWSKKWAKPKYTLDCTTAVYVLGSRSIQAINRILFRKQTYCLL